MIIEASVTGTFRMILIIIGVIVLLRFIGQLMNAKNNIEQEKRDNERRRNLKKEHKKVSKNMGKTNILTNSNVQDVEDVDYESVD